MTDQEEGELCKALAKVIAGVVGRVPPEHAMTALEMVVALTLRRGGLQDNLDQALDLHRECVAEFCADMATARLVQ